ncbi:Substrate-specific component NikM of nickel ECF transporter / Additional substrate-specific component NikN of nickel ECF transporter [Olavius algarvensis Delta 1 endosymbiont]|nr:Substrate-specific component NikM of nickel ECF transporter / Additional substrate-specific component NikN of nickel ECF transporter [Olavius algarvensis Delta 1 endosymbiont]
MHMADALISPVVGGTMWAASAGLIGYCSKKITDERDDATIPLMGVVGAFVFAAQMINFTIPGTGSSGHLGGGMILAILLGPYAGLLTMASVLIVQALFFADGGLLALGCNIFNLGFLPCFIAYPLMYKNIAGTAPSERRLFTAAIISAVVGLQLGAFSVVLQTFFSGVTELPLDTFALLMQPIHLAIGIVEGLATSAVVLFVWKARPEIIKSVISSAPVGSISLRKVTIGFVAAAVVTGGALSWFASTNPDGLEWAIFKAAGTTDLDTPAEELHTALSKVQEKTALLPDYGFNPENAEQPAETPGSETAVDTGKTVSGLVGGALTLLLAGLLGYVLKRRKIIDPEQ